MLRKPKIVVAGSLNMDLVLTLARLPQIGETIRGESIDYIPGGKGANQAVGCARLGADVSMIGAVGDDPLGRTILDDMRRYGVDCGHVRTLTGLPTGTATIMRTLEDNCIVIVPGANGAVTPEMIEAGRERIEGADMLLVQLEIPLDAVETALRIAKDAGVATILNPAPAQKLDGELLRLADYVTPNETECAAMLDRDAETEPQLAEAMRLWKERYGGALIVTRGKAGSSYLAGGVLQTAPALKVKVADTTGAGDCFNAALAYGLSTGRSLGEAACFAAKAASVSVTRFGAQNGMPTLAEVDRYAADETTDSQSSEGGNA